MTDTAPEAARVLTEVYRRMSPGQKWLRLGEMYRASRLLHAAGMRLRCPAASPANILSDWVHLQFGIELPQSHGEPVMDPDSLRGLRAVTEILEALGIPYALGGSMACAVYARGRQTNDADISVPPFAMEDRLIAALGPDYYVSASAIAEAIRERGSFNIINTLTGFKVDVFIRKDSPFEQSAWSRRSAVSLPDHKQPLVIHSPEDLLLFKLRWYRLGNETSELQWRDIQELLTIQAERLDNAYLDHWAADLGVVDLLARARQESIL